MIQILADHQELFCCIRDGRSDDAESLIRSHLSRVINLLGAVRASHPEYFADD